MANTGTFEKRGGDLSVKCASAITDTRLAYKLSATDHETVELCTDNAMVAGLPDRKAAIGETFLARWEEWTSLVGLSDGNGLLAIGDPITSGATGYFRKAVIGTDLVQGYVLSPATNVAGTAFSFRPVK